MLSRDSLEFPGITNKDQPYDGVLVQLRDPRLKKFVLEKGSEDDLVIIRYEAGQDDLRLLADNIDRLQKLLSGLHDALLSDEEVDEKIEAEFNEFEARLNDLAAQFYQNMLAAGDIIAEYNNERIRRGWTPIRFEPVYSWSLFEQDRIPFGLLKKQDNAAPLPSWLKVDLTDPKFPRSYIAVDEIDEGHYLARWAWVKLTEAQIGAQEAIQAKHPALDVVPEWLVGVNEGDLKQRFYAAIVNGKLDQKGDGHPGMIAGGISGIDFIAARILALWERYLSAEDGLEEGPVTANEYAEFSGQTPKRRAA